MYNRTFWKDHVTEFDNRFREQNNADGTISHIPVEGEIIQEGTPQNARNFNNIEVGIFAANEIASELSRIALHGGKNTVGGDTPAEDTGRIIYQEIEIPADTWERGESGYCCDVPCEGVTDVMTPLVSIPKTVTQNPSGFAFDSVETISGNIRFRAEQPPKQTLRGYALLLTPYAQSSGATVLKAASAADVADVISGIFD